MIPEFSNLLATVQKFSFVLGAVLYLLFAFIVVKQVSMMSRNVNDKFNAILIGLSYLHLAFSAFLVFLTLVIL